MTQTGLIFWPHKPSCLGLWRPDHHEPWQTMEVTLTPNSSTNQLFTALDKLLASEELTLKDITHLGIMTGPASYTELRNYVAAANAIAWARHLPLFSFGPEHTLPNDIPNLITQAKINAPAAPIYPHVIP